MEDKNSREQSGPDVAEPEVPRTAGQNAPSQPPDLTRVSAEAASASSEPVPTADNPRFLEPAPPETNPTPEAGPALHMLPFGQDPTYEPRWEQLVAGEPLWPPLRAPERIEPELPWIAASTEPDPPKPEAEPAAEVVEQSNRPNDTSASLDDCIDALPPEPDLEPAPQAAHEPDPGSAEEMSAMPPADVQTEAHAQAETATALPSAAFEEPLETSAAIEFEPREQSVAAPTAENPELPEAPKQEPILEVASAADKPLEVGAEEVLPPPDPEPPEPQPSLEPHPQAGGHEPSVAEPETEPAATDGAVGLGDEPQLVTPLEVGAEEVLPPPNPEPSEPETWTEPVSRTEQAEPSVGEAEPELEPEVAATDDPVGLGDEPQAVTPLEVGAEEVLPPPDPKPSEPEPWPEPVSQPGQAEPSAAEPLYEPEAQLAPLSDTAIEPDAAAAGPSHEVTPTYEKAAFFQNYRAVTSALPTAVDAGIPPPAPQPQEPEPAPPIVFEPGPAATSIDATPEPASLQERGKAVLWKAGRYALYGIAGYIALILLLIPVFRFVNPPGSALIAQRFVTGTSIDRTWVPLEKISPNLVRAVVVAEDSRFCQHWGIDFDAIELAIEQGGRGASTISMQVTKNLFLWSSRSYIRKAIELPLTMLLELAWPKWRILEVYLNIAEWGDGVFGAEAAAQHHFKKHAARLSQREAALLAAALPNPVVRIAGAPGPRTEHKARVVQARVRAYGGVASCVTSLYAPAPADTPLRAPRPQRQQQKQPQKQQKQQQGPWSPTFTFP